MFQAEVPAMLGSAYDTPIRNYSHSRVVAAVFGMCRTRPQGLALAGGWPDGTTLHW